MLFIGQNKNFDEWLWPQLPEYHTRTDYYDINAHVLARKECAPMCFCFHWFKSDAWLQRECPWGEERQEAGQVPALQSWGQDSEQPPRTLVSWGTAYSISSTPSADWYTRSNFPGSLAPGKPNKQLNQLQTRETLNVYHKNWSKSACFWGLFWGFFVLSVWVHNCNQKSRGKIEYYTSKLR